MKNRLDRRPGSAYGTAYRDAWQAGFDEGYKYGCQDDRAGYFALGGLAAAAGWCACLAFNWLMNLA
jgi:hypothetical protein